jgi:hypothetical protein
MTDSTKPDLKQGTAARRTVIDPAWREDRMGRVLAAENLRNAWPQGKANPGAPGGEGMTSEDSRRLRGNTGRAFAQRGEPRGDVLRFL